MLRARVLAAANIGRVYAAAVIVLAIVETAESLEPTECTRDHIKEAISGISACKPRYINIPYRFAVVLNFLPLFIQCTVHGISKGNLETSNMQSMRVLLLKP